MQRTRNIEAGQAATEFIIAAVFLLVPLFLIIPLIGKYIDIRHAAIGQARFSAWEYTVWLGDKGKSMAGIDGNQSAGIKRYQETIDQGLARYFGDPTAPAYGKPAAALDINPLWRDHRGIALFSRADIASPIRELDTPAPLGVLGEIAEKLFQFLGEVFGLFGDLLGFLGTHAKFDAINMAGYSNADVQVTVKSLGQVLPRLSLAEAPQEHDGPLVIQAKAGVQADNWNAGSRNNATSESRGLVITSLLSPLTTPVNKALQLINRGLSHIPGFDIKLPGLPDFGHVEDDLIPFEHLTVDDKQLKDSHGLSSYEKK